MEVNESNENSQNNQNNQNNENIDNLEKELNLKEENLVTETEENKGIDKETREKIKEELQNNIIIKLQDKVNEQEKEICKLRQENTVLKDNLLYILKRVILTKDEYSITKDPNKSIIKDSSKDYKSFNVFSLSREEIPSKLNESEINPRENNKAKNIDNKVNSYLNIMYNKHFGNPNEKKYLLNKDESIYNELFGHANTIDLNKSVCGYNNTEGNFKRKKQGASRLRNSSFNCRRKNSQGKFHKINNSSILDTSGLDRSKNYDTVDKNRTTINSEGYKKVLLKNKILNHNKPFPKKILQNKIKMEKTRKGPIPIKERPPFEL